MGDLRNKIWKLERDRRTREMQARLQLRRLEAPPIIYLCRCGNSQEETTMFMVAGLGRIAAYCQGCAPLGIRALCWPRKR